MATGGYSPSEEGSFGEEDEGTHEEEEESLVCTRCDHHQTFSCEKCGHRSCRHGIDVKKARNVIYADTVLASDLDFGDEKETCVLEISPGGGLYVDKVSTLITANNFVTFPLGSKDKVKVAMASDLQELKKAPDNVFILKNHWSSVLENPDSSSQDKEVILTQIIHKGTKDLFDQVFNLIQHAELPQGVIQNLYNKFQLRLLGLTKDLQILLEGSAERIKNLSASQRRDIQQELSRFVPEDQRHQLTWKEFSRHPVQCSDGGEDSPRPAGRFLARPGGRKRKQETPYKPGFTPVLLDHDLDEENPIMAEWLRSQYADFHDVRPDREPTTFRDDINKLISHFQRVMGVNNSSSSDHQGSDGGGIFSWIKDRFWLHSSEGQDFR